MIVNDLHVKIPPEVIEKIAFYVYKLIDPRNGKVFYIGKGFGERVLAHVREEADLSDDEGEILLSPKLETIRAIKNAGLDPIHIISLHTKFDANTFCPNTLAIAL